MQTSDANSDKQILGEHPTDELIKALYAVLVKVKLQY